jgi:hypothetical protein
LEWTFVGNDATEYAVDSYGSAMPSLVPDLAALGTVTVIDAGGASAAWDSRDTPSPARSAEGCFEEVQDQPVDIAGGNDVVQLYQGASAPAAARTSAATSRTGSWSRAGLSRCG